MNCDMILRRRGYKLTPQRRLILDIVHGSVHLRTAEEIFAIAHEKMPGVNKSTIYRTLDLLEKLGCVFKNELNNKIVYSYADESDHQHLVCTVCGKALECDECLLLPTKKMLEDKYGFQVNLKHLVMSGICQECRNKM